MKTLARTSLLLVGLILALLVGTPAPPSFAAKPKAPPPTPSPPPVLYEIKFWDLPNASLGFHPNDFNNRGQGVGYMEMPDGQNHAYLYDDATGSAVDLHTLYSGDPDVFPGRRVGLATGINDHGVIVGLLGDMDNPDVRIPYILDPLDANGIVPLPDFGPLGSHTSYVRINNNYDIVIMYVNADGSHGAYFYKYDPIIEDLTPDTLQPVPGPLLFRGAISPISLNNATPAQVGGQLSDFTPFLWTSGPGGGLQTLPLLQARLVTGLNDAGVLCGNASKQGKSYPMRLSTTTLNILTGAANYQAFSINNSGDVLLSAGSSATDRSNLIFHNELGYFDLDNLVIGTGPNADDDLADWLAGSPLAWFVNDPDPITGFGQIIGALWFSDGTARPFILTPIAAP